MERNNQVIQRGRPVSGLDAAHANEYFEQFVNASTLKHILGYYRGLIDNLHLKPNVFSLFYPKLRANLTSWRAKAVWKKFDARASHKCYGKGKISGNSRVLIIGGGPCGLRTAIEAQLLGAKVVVIEKRDRFSRNNVLHLWPFVIEDLRMLGAKKFFGKFCAGAIDHISIRQLQCILLKVALLLGIEVHTEVSFEKLIEPNATEKTGWRAEFKPSNHPVNHYEFDVIIGADGKRNTLQGFSRKEFRGKLAIAITANFINRKTEAEASVEEISGVAFIFNQKFFKELQEETRIDLENIVYYKDDTHYFVMTAKKASLLEKGVIKQDLADTEKLLAPDNVDRDALQQYAIDAANFSTNYQLPHLEFAVNHYGQPDIAMFDFTSMYAAENASKLIERNGYRLLMILVGDSLLEPFWPTGSGCARGFLSSLDAAWAIRSWSTGTCNPLEVLAERESIYRLLAQTTPDNLNKDWKSYTLDPSTRYPNLNKTVVLPHQAVSLCDTDNPANIDKMKRNSQERTTEVPRKRRRGNVDNGVLLNWLKDQLKEDQNVQVTDIESVFKSGKILCAIIHHYRPDLIDYNSVQDNDPAKNNQLAFDILEKELGIPPVMTGEEITNTEDYLTMATYLTEVYDIFRGEIPHIKHPKLKKSSKIPKLVPSKAKTKNQFSRSQNNEPVILEKSDPVDLREINNRDNLKICKNQIIRSKTKGIGETKNDGNISSIEPNMSLKKVKQSKSHNVKKSCNEFNDLRNRKLKKPKTVSCISTELTKKISKSKPSKNNVRSVNEKKTKNNLIDDNVNNINTAENKCTEKKIKKRSSTVINVHGISKNNMINHDAFIQKKKLDIQVCEQNICALSKSVSSNNHNYDNKNSTKVCLDEILYGTATKFADANMFQRNTINAENENIKKEYKRNEIDVKIKNKIKSLSRKKSIQEVDHCLQSLEKEKNKKMKMFMTKLLLKKRKSTLKKSDLSVISEDNIEPSDTLINTKKPQDNIDFKPRAQNRKRNNYNDLTIENSVNIYNVNTAVNDNYFLNKTSNDVTFIKEILPVKQHSSSKYSSNTCFNEFPSNETLVKIRCIERKPRNKLTIQKIEFVSSLNQLTISSKVDLQETPYNTKVVSNKHLDSKKKCSVPIKIFEEFEQKFQETSGDFITDPKCDIFHNLLHKIHNCDYEETMKVNPNLKFMNIKMNENISRNNWFPSRKNYKPSCKHFKPIKERNCPIDFLHKLGSSDFERLLSNCQCPIKSKSQKQKFLSKKRTMHEGDELPNQIYSRVSNWISSNDFLAHDNSKGDTDVDTVLTNSKNTDITSVSKMDEYEEVVVEERTDVVKFDNFGGPVSSEENFTELMKSMNNNKIKPVRTLSKFSQYSPFQSVGNLKSSSAPPTQFSVIVEGEETELPESTKVSDLSFKTIKTSNIQALTVQQSRPSSRHKRHIEPTPNKACSIDNKKTRKRRTLEKVGLSVMFSLFLHAFLETGVVAVILFILDILINSEQYGYQNYIFSASN